MNIGRFASFKSMNDTTRESGSFTGVGRWITVATELPCSIIVFLFIGQLLGQQLYGPQGALTGALLGVGVGFIFGVYSVFVTIRRFEHIEHLQREQVRQYMPSEEEIFEEYDWSSKMKE